MNYKIHYNSLIKRAKNRTLNEYTEKHRIIPGCMGGKYTNENVVRLTPEEHYVSHQLLVKIYPNEGGLVFAAMMMTLKSKRVLRNNKVYGWLKRKYVIECRKRVGSKNSAYGKKWFHNPTTLKTKLFLDNNIPPGWKRGRVPSNFCKTCYKKISPDASHCVEHMSREKRQKNNPFYNRENEFYKLYDNLGSMNKACKAMGFPGAISHWHRRAKELLNNRLPS